jgi:hypothetical protein
MSVVRVCSASDEIHFAYAQCAMKFVPRMLSMDLHVKTAHIFTACAKIRSSYAQCAMKSFPPMLSVR